MAEEKDKTGCFGLIAAFFASLASHGGCQKLLKYSDDIHIPKFNVEIPAKPHVSIPDNSFSLPQEKTHIPGSRFVNKSKLPSYKGNLPEPPIIKIPNDEGLLKNPFLIPDNVNWNDSSVKSVKATIDNDLRDGIKRAEQLGLSEEAKKDFLLKIAMEAGKQKRKELSNEKIFISSITVDTIALVSVNQALQKEKTSQKEYET